MAEQRLWPTDPTPALTDVSESVSVGFALGTVFSVNADGNIIGAYIRVSDTPPPTECRLLLFVNGTTVANKVIAIGTGGWTRFEFDAPQPLVAGDECIIYYWQEAAGPNIVRYTATSGIFNTDVDSGNLHAPDTTEALNDFTIDVAGNGVFEQNIDPESEPTVTFNASSYWVDPIFEPLGAGGTLVIIEQHSQYNAGTL